MFDGHRLVTHKLSPLNFSTAADLEVDPPLVVVPLPMLDQTPSEPDPLVGPAWCSSSQSCEHSTGATPWICAANAEEIIHKLREADVLLSQGKTVSQACKQIGVSDQTYYRWRKIYGGMKVDQAKRLKELEAENARADLGRSDEGPAVHVRGVGSKLRTAGRTRVQPFRPFGRLDTEVRRGRDGHERLPARGPGLEMARIRRSRAWDGMHDRGGSGGSFSERRPVGASRSRH